MLGISKRLLYINLHSDTGYILYDFSIESSEKKDEINTVFNFLQCFNFDGPLKQG